MICVLFYSVQFRIIGKLYRLHEKPRFTEKLGKQSIIEHDLCVKLYSAVYSIHEHCKYQAITYMNIN